MAPRRTAEVRQEEEQICPLCINELDDTEKAWLPCSCGYQLCLFCYDRLKTEFSNRCPNCRLEYDCDFEAGLLRRQERAAQLQHDLAAAAAAAGRREPAPAAPAAPRPITVLVAERPGSKHVQPPPPPPPRGVRWPRRDLNIEQERVWPSLGAAAQPAAPHHQQQQQQQHTPPQRLQQPDAAARRLGSPPQLAAILAQRGGGGSSSSAEHEGSGGGGSSSSRADTSASTPQSPASSVVCFRAAATALPADPALPLSAASTSGKAALQGRCAVVLQRGGGSCLGLDVDLEGASLAASLQEAVRAGSLSVRQAAASLASYLRQRQHQQQLAGSSAGSSPARGSGRQPSSAGSTPFSHSGGAAGGLAATSSGVGLLSAEPSLAPCDSGQSVATSASLSHWAPEGTAPASLPLQQQPPLHGLLGSGLASSTSWQQQQQQQQQQQGSGLQVAQPAAAALVGSPVRDNDRLPLFMRRGTLPASQGSNGSPSSAGGSSSASGSSGASFPGFPSGPNSPTQELKRLIAPPPGFGPPAIGSSGIAPLPRFQ